MTRGLTATLTLAAAAGLLCAQTGAPAKKGAVEHIKVHGKSLEGNLEGDSPDRDVAVYLPPSYATSGARRYPVIYLLHGFGNTDATWLGDGPRSFHAQDAADRVFGPGAAQEMILVAPNAFTVFQGGFYGSSVTTGDWESFLAKELVFYIDSHYRAIANRMSRGLAGHSMGGYGTIRLGMKYPDVFSSIYAMSACCLAPTAMPAPGERWTVIENVKSTADVTKQEFGTKVAMAEAASWSPNPNNPPFYFDLPVKNGVVQPMVVAEWMANSPLVMAEQYAGNLRKLHAIGLEIGEQDQLVNPVDVKVLDAILTRLNAPHALETYEGNHGNKIAERFETKALPFFSKNLEGKK